MSQRKLVNSPTYRVNLVSSGTVKYLVDDNDELYIEGYANTIVKDRAGDVIPREAWEKESAMSNYAKNPIILAYHNHSKPIGKMVEYEVTEFGLKIKAKISKGAGDVYHLIKDGVLSAFSVGFGIRDANYDSKTDTYNITDVELLEVSVVSVPCNQDSVFSVSKSMSKAEFDSFKHTFSPELDSETIKVDKETNTMTKEELQAMLAELNVGTKSEDTEAAVARALEAERVRAEKAAADKAAQEAAKAAAKAEAEATAKAAAESLVKEMQDALKQDASAVNTLVKAQQEEIIKLRDEIAAVVAQRNRPAMTPVAKAMALGVSDKEREKNIDALVMVATIKDVGMFETNFGKKFEAAEKAVNGSSSIQVSSEAYETEFATNLIRDIQAQLVVAPLFTEMAMNSAQMTIPVNPNRGNATWVAAPAMGDGSDPARTGGEITAALTERTLKTYKLAAKTYLTEETEEDAIISLLPILRQHLVEAHVNEMDRAFLIGSGTGQPKGIVTQALAVAGSAQTHVTTATATGTVKVTAAMILAARRKLGLYGINLNEIVAVISQDAYWDLLEDAAWGDVQQVGMEATKLKGEVGNVYGMRVIVSNQFAAKAASAAFGVLVNTNNFVVPRQRGVTLRSDFDIELDRTVFVATQRVNIEPLIDDGNGNGKGVVALTYAA